MKILYLLTWYQIGDGVSNTIYNQIINKKKWDEYIVVAKWVKSYQKDLNIYQYKKSDIINVFLEKKIDLIHYFKGNSSDILNKVLKEMHKQNLKIPVITTICQKPSFKTLLLSPFEIHNSNQFVFIDKASYNDKFIQFIPTSLRHQIYFSPTEELINKTANIQYKDNDKGGIIYGRGSTISKCPSDMFEVFDNIDVPNKEFHIVGIPRDGNWVHKEALKRHNVKFYGFLPYEEWFDVCKTFDVVLYQIPEESHASIDGNLGLPMLMKKPSVYYGSEAPKERFINGVNGFIANNKKEISYYATLLGKNFELRKRMGEKARETTISNFSYKKKMSLYEKVYHEATLYDNVKIRIPLSYYIIYVCRCYRRIIQETFGIYRKH